MKGGINCALNGSVMSVLTLSSWQLLLNISISNGYVDVIIKIYVNLCGVVEIRPTLKTFDVNTV